MTSVKMQLFSLNRSCTFTDAQQEDFNVIIIAEHGGWLDVSGKEGNGAAFVISLPVREG